MVETLHALERVEMGSVEKDTLRLLGELQESAEKAREGNTAEKVRFINVCFWSRRFHTGHRIIQKLWSGRCTLEVLHRQLWLLSLRNKVTVFPLKL